MKFKPIFNLFFTFLITLLLGIALTELKKQSIALLIVYSVFFIWFGFRSLVFAFKKETVYNSVQADIDTRDSKLDFNPSNLPPFGFIITFGLICNQLYLYNNSLFEIQINSEASLFDKYEWMIYAIDNFIRAVGLDFLETFHIHISKIDSSNNWVLLFVFLFKTVLSIFFIKSIINLFIATKKIESAYK